MSVMPLRSRVEPFIQRVLFRIWKPGHLDVLSCGHTMDVRTTLGPNETQGARICLACLRRLPPVLPSVANLPEEKKSALYWTSFDARRVQGRDLEMTRVLEIMKS